MANLLIAGLSQESAPELDASLKQAGFSTKYVVKYPSVLITLNSFNPDLFICLHNPETFDGFEFLDTFSAHPKLQTIRKIFISEQNDRTCLRKAMAMGADDFIPAPYEISEIIDAIETQLQRSQLFNTHTNVPPSNDSSYLMTEAELQKYFSELNHESTPDGTTNHLYLLGIDQLNWFRSALGSQLSDTILKRFSERLIASRETLEHSFKIATIDHQHFALLAHTGQETKVAAALNEQWQQSISRPIEINNQEIQITTSFAAIEFQVLENCDFEMLIGQAKQTLKHINKHGGNQFRAETFCPKFKSSYQFEIATNLMRGLIEDEFHAYYQPQVDLETGKFVGVEALVRWHHHEWGTLEPGRFIPIAEETGMITQIDERVLRLACKAIQRWQNNNFEPLKVSVNLSALSFNRPNLDEVVQDILEEFRISPEWLELEITESMLVQDTTKAAQIMAELKAIGVSIALDDFGVGYSSLSYLQRFPIDTLKIDRCFIHKVDQNRGNAAIAEAVIKLAHDLGLKVIAEGVERVAERDFLRQHHCNAMQGYLISHPVPRSVFETFLTAQKEQDLAIA